MANPPAVHTTYDPRALAELLRAELADVAARFEHARAEVLAARVEDLAEMLEADDPAALDRWVRFRTARIVERTAQAHAAERSAS